MWWCAPISLPGWCDTGGAQGFCLSPQGVGSVNAWLAVIKTQSLSTEYRDLFFIYFFKYEISVPPVSEAFKPADTQIGFQHLVLPGLTWRLERSWSMTRGLGGRDWRAWVGTSISWEVWDWENKWRCSTCWLRCRGCDGALLVASPPPAVGLSTAESAWRLLECKMSK